MQYLWIVSILMAVFTLDYVLVTTGSGTYYKADYLSNTNQKKEQEILQRLQKYLHRCSINSNCNYVVEDMKNGVKMYHSRSEIPAEEKLLGIWMKMRRGCSTPHILHRKLLPQRSQSDFLVLEIFDETVPTIVAANKAHVARLLLPSAPKFGKCDFDFILTGQYSYRVVKEALNWQDAREQCQLHGGELASITNKQEEEKIKHLLSGFTTRRFYWIGLNDIEEEGRYVWIDGSEYNYNNWREGEPNNLKNEDCMVTTQSLIWFDYICGDKGYFICQNMVE